MKIVNITREGYLNEPVEGEYDYIDETISKKFPRTILKENDLVMAVRGATIGKIAIVPRHFEGANINANLIRISLKKEKILPRYFWAYFNSNIGQSLFNQQVANTAKQTVTVPQIRDLLVPLPPMEIQRKIADRIELEYNKKRQREAEADKIVQNVEEVIAQKIGFQFPKVEEKNTFVVNVSLFENRLDPHFYLPNFKALLDNIRKTKNVQLGNLVEFSKEIWNQKDGFQNEFPYIEISEINLASGRINNVSLVPINEAPSRAKMVVRENDIIVSTTRPHRGAISLIEKDKDGFIASTGFAILRNLKTDEISKQYLFYMLRTQICLLQMLQRSSGGSYPAITTDELKNIYIPIPEKHIQQEIVGDIKAFINRAEQLKEDAKAEFEKAKREIEKLILS